MSGLPSSEDILRKAIDLISQRKFSLFSPTYRIKDLEGEEIKGSVYEQEMVTMIADVNTRNIIVNTRNANGTQIYANKRKQ